MYALINNGVVTELFTPPSGFTLAECFHPDVAAQFVAVGSATVAVGYLYSGGVFSAPPAPPAPTLAQQATAAIGKGIAITSTGTPALDGTYACDETAQGQLNRVAGYITTNGKFPAGLTAMPWPDISGVVHEFATTAEFQALASAVANYVVELDAVIMGLATTLPAASATIP
ncbi:hypothetical protein [Acidiphilium sp.]|uniref:DUF4376 domain-containing protein n=1 Tax=Acidiphilium sp. TaxID=527 RepID=UPI003CFCB7A3